MIMHIIEEKLRTSGWFKYGRTMRETVVQFELFGYNGEDITNVVLDMESRGLLYTYPSKYVGTCYRLRVQAEPEFDIGV